MTALTDHPDEISADAELDRVKGRNRVLLIVVVVLALVVAGLVVWVIYDAATEPDTGATASEIEQVMEDYRTAWDEQDPEAFGVLATDDVILHEYIYRAVDDGYTAQNFSFSGDRAASLVGSGWQIEHGDEAIVVGEGPWFVTVAETWVNEDTTNDGTANYVLVEQDGTLKVANAYWVGFEG
jgi:hypothetical protein